MGYEDLGLRHPDLGLGYGDLRLGYEDLGLGYEDLGLGYKDLGLCYEDLWRGLETTKPTHSKLRSLITNDWNWTPGRTSLGVQGFGRPRSGNGIELRS